MCDFLERRRYKIKTRAIELNLQLISYSQRDAQVKRPHTGRTVRQCVMQRQSKISLDTPRSHWLATIELILAVAVATDKPPLGIAQYVVACRWLSPDFVAGGWLFYTYVDQIRSAVRADVNSCSSIGHSASSDGSRLVGCSHRGCCGSFPLPA